MNFKLNTGKEKFVLFDQYGSAFIQINEGENCILFSKHGEEHRIEITSKIFVNITLPSFLGTPAVRIENANESENNESLYLFYKKEDVNDAKMLIKILEENDVLVVKRGASDTCLGNENFCAKINKDNTLTFVRFDNLYNLAPGDISMIRIEKELFGEFWIAVVVKDGIIPNSDETKDILKNTITLLLKAKDVKGHLTKFVENLEALGILVCCNKKKLV